MDSSADPIGTSRHGSAARSGLALFAQRVEVILEVDFHCVPLGRAVAPAHPLALAGRARGRALRF